AVVYALGDRVPLSGKVFLATLAIVDDLGAVLIIALFYTSNISLINVVMGLGFLTLLYAANRLGVKSVWFYGIVGIGGVWVSFLLSGVHATIAAVLIAFTIPADSTIPEATFITRLKQLGQRFRAIEPNEVRVLEPEQVDILARIKEEALRATPPLQRLERNLHPVVSFVVLPIFALANAGIAFIDMDMATLFSTHIGLGVALGLLVGKPLGVALAVWVLMRLRWGSLSPDLSWHHIWAIGCLAGIGFTMSMFVTVLAFTDPIDITQAKLGIFIASLISGIIGYLLLWRGSKAKKAFEA
ncbi:MAG: Na+/H+ antiporter NhaA, partial [Bacteroidales bacterium]|nr:Na+/H+ antiporter NhaA [Bacteroidales bacterium]